jgi:hypothetical protein
MKAITLALEANGEISTLSILTYSAFSINTLNKYAIDPFSFIPIRARTSSNSPMTSLLEETL